LYYHYGRYYYDPSFTVYADVDNEWNSIAAISGGLAIAGALTNDPFLFFAGAAGSLYSLSQYDDDRYSSDPERRLRATYFSKPYFWRNGVRYDRVVVDEDGTRYYQFRRHW